MTISIPIRVPRGVRALVAAIAAAVLLALVLAAQASAAGTTLNVNPVSGRDTNTGSATSPLRTLTKALAKAHTGDTVSLAAGRYSQNTNGEQYSPLNGNPTVVVPAGVTIKGTAGGTAATELDGAPSQIGLRLNGNATISNVSLTGFGAGIQAAQGTQTLSALIFQGGGIRLTGTAHATLAGTIDPESSLPGNTLFKDINGTAVSVVEQAHFTITGGVMVGHGPGGDGTPNCDTTQAGIFASGSAIVTVHKTIIQDLAGGAVNVTGDSRATLDGALIGAAYDSSQCVPQPAAQANGNAFLDVQNSTLDSNLQGSVFGTDGIRAGSTDGLLVQSSQILGFNGDGIDVRPAVNFVDVEDTELNSNGFGLQAFEPSGVQLVVIRNSTVTNNREDGIDAFDLTMRFTNVTANGAAGVAINGGFVDLGTDTDPGGNTLAPNGFAGVQYDDGASGTIDAVGDLWDAGQQGANVFGFYDSPTTIDGGGAPAVGDNFVLPDPGQIINLGPLVGRLALTPSVLHARAGKVAHLKLAWTHPAGWRQLKSIQLRLYRGPQLVGAIAIDPLTARLSSHESITLLTSKSRVDRAGKTVTARLAFRLPRSLAGRTLRLAVQATDRHHHRQLEPDAGSIHLAPCYRSMDQRAACAGQ